MMTENKESLSAILPWKFPTRVTRFWHRIIKLFVPTVKVPFETVKVSDVTIDSTRNLWFRLFIPTEVPDELMLPVVVFFHGGGFNILSPDTREYDDICRRFARKIPAIVISVNYRHSPEFQFPAPYDDGYDSLKFIDKKEFEGFPKNADLSRCFIAGDSAGGNIAHHVAVRVAEDLSQFNELKMIGLISIQPYFGGEERTESEIGLQGAPAQWVETSDEQWKAFLPDGANRDHEASNVFGPNSSIMSNLENFPPTLVFIGGFDPLRGWQTRYYEGLKICGMKAYLVEYPNAIHAFYVFPELPEATLFLTEVIDFVNSNGEFRK